MKIAVSTESAVDLSPELLEKYDIKIISFGINFNNELVQDRSGISEEIFEHVEKTKNLPKTSAVSPLQFKDYFESLKKEYDAIIHISISSSLSCTYNNALMVANEMKDVYVIDSKNLSAGIALLAIYARELVDSGKTVEEVYNMTNACTEKVRVHFVVDKLNYLYKGGRCNALTLLGANMLKIKPEIVVQDGRMGLGKKYRGHMIKVCDTFGDDMLSTYPNPDKKYVFITHSSPMPEEEKLLETKLKNAGFKKIYNTLAGGTVCSHCGPNTIGILFIEK